MIINTPEKLLHGVTRRREALCLTEILVSLLIIPMVLCGLAAVTYIPLRIMRHAEDISTAQDRAELVFSILTIPLEHCGYGLPKQPGDYTYAFNTSLPPFTWPGPLSIGMAVLPDGIRENGNCKIAYAVETKSRTIEKAETASNTMQVTVNSVPSLLNSVSGSSGSGSDVNNWILFGSMMPYCLPARKNMTQTTLSNGDVRISVMFNRPASGGETLWIPENDELFYLRVMECQVRSSEKDSIFATRDYMNTGWQPRVEGVVDVRFELEPNRRLIRVWTLTHGSQRFANVVTSGTPPGWPEKYADGISDECRHYRLLAREAVFSLQNL
ncbi:MAG: hypothetical protein FWE55_00800 [Synergistaceae bacterium]|nr:hypothetical protein [Synergistaceae bacterium]